MQQIINKKAVKSNKILKNNQKKANSFYGKGKSKVLKAKLNKIVPLDNIKCIELAEKKEFNIKDIVNIDQLINLCDEHNMVGLSGDGAMVSIKLNAIKECKDKILLVNAVECDPGLIQDHYLLNNKQTEIINGINKLNKIIGFKRIIIATKENINNDNIEIVKVPNVYPMGYERFLIKEVLGIDYDNYPSEKGILELNFQTVYKMGDLLNGIEFNSRYITVSDLKKGAACVANVEFNAKISDVVNKIYPNAKGVIYAGGGTLFAHKANFDELLDPTINLISIADEYIPLEQKCKGCGKCSSNCPMHINLKKIVKNAEKNINNNPKEIDTSGCIYCGLCSFNCFADKDIRGLVASINGIK